MSVINTNVKSLVAQQSLSINGRNLATAMERLSTGQKINSAKDDAAGLAISTRMTAQVRGLNMAIKNANDGMSLLQTAEGAMNEVTNMLQRMRELGVQAATDTVSASDRADMNKEVQALKAEINRISATTQFNGINILDGSFSKKQFQIGDQAGVTLDVSLRSVGSASLGASVPLSKGVVVSDRVNVAALYKEEPGVEEEDPPTVTKIGSVFINGTAVSDLSANYSGSDDSVIDLADVVKAINTSNVGVTASAYNEVVAKFKGSGVSSAGDVIITVTALDTGENTVINLGDTTSLQDMVNQINAMGGENTVLARLNDQGKLVLYNNSGASIQIEDNSDALTIGGQDVIATGFGDSSFITTYDGFLKLSSNNGEIFTVEYGTAADAETLGLNQITSDGTVVASDALDLSAITGPEDYLSGSLRINGVDIWYSGLDLSQATDIEDEFVKTINRFSGETGVTAGLTVDGRLTLRSTGNSPIQIRLSEDFKQVLGTGDFDDALHLMEMNSGAADFDFNEASLGYFAGGSTVSGTNLLTKDAASATIKTMDGALSQISGYRADIGAQINRLTSTVDNLANVVTNTEASRSRILDTDYASETTKLARAQIIQQAATAMLAQANQQPQTVLALLQ